MENATFQKLLPVVGAEHVNYYRPGGFHPVHLEDTFKDGRYKVIHKLGYGASATVWLVYDKVLKRYSSLKILAAEISDTHPEVAVLQHLQRYGTGYGKEYVVKIFDFFKHSGPNGVHQCIVMEVLGPCIPTYPYATSFDNAVMFNTASTSSDTAPMWSDTAPTSSDASCTSFDTNVSIDYEIFSADVAKHMSAQIAHGLAYIHNAGIVHGDLHPGNILLHSPVITSWSRKGEVERYLGVPIRVRLQLWDSTNLAPSSPHLPSYIVPPPEPKPLLKLCLSKTDPTQVNVKICDFSEAFIQSIHTVLPPRNTPVVYASPELIFGDPTGRPADIWALAVLIHTLITNGVHLLFPSARGIREQVIRAMVLALGKLPEKWWYKFEERGKYFNENGEWVGDSEDIHPAFDILIRLSRDMDEKEAVAYEELIRRMVTYDPEERASIDQVIKWMDENRWNRT